MEISYRSSCGNGNASKNQVAAMLESLFKIKEMPKHLDATDGLAAATCHYFQARNISKTNQYSGWKSYIKNNPDKIS